MLKIKQKILLSLLLLITLSAVTQEHTPVTDIFLIEGKVKNSFSFSLDQAKAYKLVSIDSLVILNHLKQKKKTISGIKGVLLTDILNKAVIDLSSPKLLSQIYIVCVAADNYKVVFSWNELFNTEIGNHVIIITEEAGKPANETEDRIALLSGLDQATGRRYVKGLSRVIIEQVK